MDSTNIVAEKENNRWRRFFEYAVIVWNSLIATFYGILVGWILIMVDDDTSLGLAIVAAWVIMTGAATHLFFWCCLDDDDKIKSPVLALIFPIFAFPIGILGLIVLSPILNILVTAIWTGICIIGDGISIIGDGVADLASFIATPIMNIITSGN